MEKDTRKDSNRNTFVLQGDDSIGSVQIADEVVAMITSLAATEVKVCPPWQAILPMN